MIGLPYRRTYRRTSRLVVALLFLVGARVSGQTQTPGQVTQFDPNLNVVDSVITQDPSGNIGIGTTTPAAALDVATGDVNIAGNLFKGGTLFVHSFGTENTFLGSNAGNLTMTGFGHSTGVGYQALMNLHFGSQNTAIGAEALENDRSGSSNTASGFGALLSNDVGGSNTAHGAFALLSNTSGGQNSAHGSQALYANTTGDFNTATGFDALFWSGTGSRNTANGVQSMYSNTTGDLNTAYGIGALYHNTTGANNTAIGASADVSTDNLTNATVLGANAVVDASNKIRLGDSQVAVIEGQVPYTFISDRNQKENFQPMDGELVLKKVGALNLTSWNYIGHDPQQFRHYGPVAQEFFTAFGQDAVGTIGTPTTINSGDLEGILMVAVQALEKRTAENADLRARIETLEKLVKGTTTQGR